jgi:hypothetical protein
MSTGNSLHPLTWLALAIIAIGVVAVIVVLTPSAADRFELRPGEVESRTRLIPERTYRCTVDGCIDITDGVTAEQAGMPGPRKPGVYSCDGDGKNCVEITTAFPE